MSEGFKKLTQTLEKFRRLEKIRSHLEELNRQLDEQYERLEVLQETMGKEYEDYARLESGNMKSWFYKVLGSKEKQLEKERQEYLQVALQYDECKNSIDLMEYEQKVLAKKLDDFESVRQKLERLKEAREKELLESGGEGGDKLLAIMKEIDDRRSEINNMDDALAAGREADEFLSKMIKYLRTAADWGNWDMYGRKGYGSLPKHSQVDRAKELSLKTKFVLRRFDAEVKGIYGKSSGADFEISMGKFARFTDIFFDNLITDWIVQQKIVNALKSVRKARKTVYHIMGRLVEDKKEVAREIKALFKRKEAVILGEG